MERAKLANWADISDVALLKRLRQGEEWLRSLRMELLKENDGLLAKQTALPQTRVVDGTVVKESGRPAACGGFCTACSCRVWYVTSSR